MTEEEQVGQAVRRMVAEMRKYIQPHVGRPPIHYFGFRRVMGDWRL